MNQKERKLLKHLLENQGTYITSQELASMLSVSDRTVRTYLNKMKDILKENGANIHSKTGYGYKLDILNRMDFDIYLTSQEVDLIEIKNNQQLMEIEDRHNYILNKLILEDEILTVERLSDRLFISESSVTKDLSEIRKLLKPYNLIIKTKSGTGFWIEGSEQEKRHFIMDNFFGKNYRNPVKDNVANSQLFVDISFEELTIIILDEVREEKLKMSDVIIQNLVLHLSLAIKRISEGFELKDSGMVIDQSNKREFTAATKIIERVEKNLAIKFPKEEVGYLTLHLMAKSNQQNQHKNDRLINELMDILQEMSNDLQINFMNDYQLYNGLLEHIKPMIVRLKKGISLKNPLKKTIQENYFEAYELTKDYMGKLSFFDSYLINDDEWAYLSLHVMAAIEKNRNFRKLRVLIICATGYGSAQLLKNRVVNEFGNSLNIIDVLGYYELNKTSLKNIDLIISSIDLSSILFKIPVIHVSVFLSQQDVDRIKKEVNKIDKLNQVVSTQSKKGKKINKIKYVEEHLKEDFFNLYEQVPTKEEVINDLLLQLKINEKENYVEKMITQIKKRENMGQVIFSDSIVVPHPAHPVGVTTKMAIALIPEGMDWDEEQDIKFVFLISPSYIENEGITSLTKGIVKLVEQQDIQKEILENITFDQFKEIFIKMIEQ